MSLYTLMYLGKNIRTGVVVYIATFKRAAHPRNLLSLSTLTGSDEITRIKLIANSQRVASAQILF